MENSNSPTTPVYYKGQYSYGLTKREYFAGLAMQGLMSNSKVNLNNINNISECVKIADELLKQLENEK